MFHENQMSFINRATINLRKAWIDYQSWDEWALQNIKEIIKFLYKNVVLEQDTMKPTELDDFRYDELLKQIMEDWTMRADEVDRFIIDNIAVQVEKITQHIKSK